MRQFTSAFGAALIGACALTTAGMAEDAPVKLRLSHNLPTNNALHYGVLEPWAKSIGEASNGSIGVDIFPAQQLGPAKDHYNMARDGIVDIAFYLVGIEPGRFPIVSAAEVPFLVSANDRGSRALYEWYQPYAATEMPDVKVCAMFYDGGGTIHAKKKIERPADLAGLKIRSPNVMAAELYRLGGASPIQMSANDAAEAVERGVVDAISFPWKLVQALGADRVLNYHMDTTLYSLATAILINKSSYERLSDAQKAVIDSHCNADWSQKLPVAWTEYEYEGRGVLLEKAGHDVYAISDEQLQEWKELAKGVQAKWAADVAAKGVDGEKTFGELKALLEKYDAAY
ncbi:TRAP dicarboxylate transporter subunit DctP [Nitratireductor pacificus pht-3B]|uniref:TRAP dicarboxylate transporter subunit DctP n=1 Tax=Nitratireductor pacificus pht-3B TaxID=391937 RepID=K2MEE8_9HYPH|nr:TRAP dicarboxylate transporter subunit DctP [Nitratireductor pacificus pht-3B]